MLSTSIISATPDGHTATGSAAIGINGYAPQNFSPDGRWLVFTSMASNLVNGVTDTNNAADLFLRDLQNNVTYILSVSSTGTALRYDGGGGNFQDTIFSPDSKFLAFRATSSNLLDGVTDPNGQPDLFVRDLTTNVTSGVSINPAGDSMGNVTSFTSFAPIFTPDSKNIIFGSLASNLQNAVPDSGGADLFIRNIETKTTTLLSVATNATAAGNVLTDTPPKLSPDGRYVAFLSSAGNLVNGVTDTNAFTDLFVKDLQTGSITLVDQTPDHVAAGFSTSFQWLPDGSGIIFGSANQNLVDGVSDLNNTFGTDFFLWKLQTQAITLVTANNAGTSTGDKTPTLLGVSPDGRYVAFSSPASNLTPQSNSDIFADLYVRDLLNNTTTFVATHGGGSVAWALARFTADSANLLFTTDANNVVPGLADTNGRSDLFAYKLATGQYSAITVKFDGTATASNDGTAHDDVVLSPDGRYVSFVSDSDNLTANFITSSTRDLFVHDLMTHTTRLVTRGSNGEGVGYDQGATRDAEFTHDGRFLVYTTNTIVASNFSYLDAATDVFAFDTQTGKNYLLSAPASGTPSNFNFGAEPFSFLLSPDHMHVAFIDASPDLVTGVTDQAANTAGAYDLFLTDLPTPSALPDLVIEGGVTGVASGTFVGGTTGGHAQVTIFNRGQNTATGTVNVKFYVSSDATLDASDKAVATVSKSLGQLAADQSTTVTADFSYPTGVANGQYFILAKADADNALEEADENNNTAASTNKITLAAASVDLSGKSLSGSGQFKSGKNAKIQLQLQNNGNTKSSGTMKVKLFASKNAIVGDRDDILIGTISTGFSVNAGGTQTIAFNPKLPKLKAGSYRLIALIDSAKMVLESNESNNTIVSAKTVKVV